MAMTRTEVLSAYNSGEDAGRAGEDLIECPFDPAINPLLAHSWLQGHKATSVPFAPDQDLEDAEDMADFPEDRPTSRLKNGAPTGG